MPAPAVAISRALPGLAALSIVAAGALLLASNSTLERLGVGSLTLAIALGMIGGNLAPAALTHRMADGTVFAQRMLLRLGVGLYGLRLTAHDLVAIGPRALLIDALVIACTLALALRVGQRWLGLDRETALLIGAGSAICGAAAVMATESVLRPPPHKVAIAVATVTIFGSLSILVYPLLFPFMGLAASDFGVYIGSTVHEVAQVVAAGRAISPATADQAVIVKLIRVALLAPVIMFLGRLLRREGTGAPGARLPALPWFIGMFLGAAALNSLGVVPAPAREFLQRADGVLLAVAMAALGWTSSLAMMRKAGARPLLLGGVLFAFLLVGGYAINRGVDAILPGPPAAVAAHAHVQSAPHRAG